jgi:long-chain acyl-CoA synthetase
VVVGACRATIGVVECSFDHGRRRLRHRPGEPAHVFDKEVAVDQPELVTSRAAGDRAARAASALRAHGLVPGDRVALLLRGSGDYLATVIGALRSGVVPVPLDPALTERERVPLVADADPALVLDSPTALRQLLDGPGAPVELSPLPQARPMHYTSGTTGRPKGVTSGLLDDQAAAALLADERDFWGITADDRHLVASPLHHSAPLRFAITTLLSGGSVMLPGPFEASRWAAAADSYRPTSAFVVPAHLTRLLAVGMPRTDSFRLLAHAGAACPDPVKRATLDAFPAGSVWEFYGSTEGQFTACSGEEWLARPGTVGRARPGRTMSLDDSGHLWCTVPDFARFSYWRDPERTAAVWRGDAFTVGDLGRIDADGYVYLDGRREDLVISGGVNVYPAEVESALTELAGVDEAAVFGVADERWGQQVSAAVITGLTDDELHAWARQRLAPAKRPKRYYRLDELPRTASGKIRRLDLADLVEPGSTARHTTEEEPGA